MAYSTLLYHSGMPGMPSATLNTAGALIALYDAVLADGVNSRTVTSVTRSGSVVTVNFSGTNNFGIADVVEVGGMDQTDYNSRFKITAKTSGSVSFNIATTPTSPGTFTAATIKHPAAGWTKASLGTNISSYRTKAGSLGHYVQVEDNNPYTDSGVTARIRLAEGLTALDTATSMSQQTKHNKAGTGWVVVADGRTCHLIIGSAQTIMMGEFVPFNGADAYAIYLSRGDAGETATASNSWTGNTAPILIGRTFPQCVYPPGMNGSWANPGIVMLRSYSQVAGSVNGHCLETVDLPAYSGANGNGSNMVTPRWQLVSSPNPADSSIPLIPFFVVEIAAQTVLRGTFRGMLHPLCKADGAQFTNNVARLDDVTIGGVLKSAALVNYGFNARTQLAFDLGDWA